MENSRKSLEEIKSILLNPNYVLSLKQKCIEKLILMMKQMIGLESIEEFFEGNVNDIKYFICSFLKDIIKEALSQQDEEEGYEYCSILLTYIDFFCLFYNHEDYGQVLQSYLVDIFDHEKPLYFSFLETYEKFNELLPKDPSKFFDYEIGDDVDVLIQTNYDNGNWVRGQIKDIKEDESGDLYYDICTSDEKRVFEFKKDSLNIQKVGTMTYDWDWRINLKERDRVDVFDRGEWYPATVLQTQKRIINGIVKVNYKIGFRLFTSDFPEWKHYAMFWKGKNLIKDQHGNNYIGDNFAFDQLIPHYSKRIQPFKSCIFTQTFPEKKLIIDDFYLYKENNKKYFIIGRNYRNFRYSYCLLLKEFYDNGGYDILLQMFDSEKDNISNSNSNSIFTALYVLVGSLCYLHKGFFEEVSEEFISKCYDYFDKADIKQLRNIRKETTDLMIQVVTFFENSKTKPNHALLSKFLLLMIIKLFKTNIFDKRLLGVKILNDYINSITNQVEQIYQFIKENNIIYEIFGPEGHEQFVSKGIGIIEVLIKKDLFQEHDLEILWTSTQKGNSDSRMSVIKLFKDNISKMNVTLVIILLEKINAQPKESLLFEEIELLFLIASHFTFDVDDHIGIYITDYLFKNVNINEEDKYKKIAEMTIKLMHQKKKYDKYFEYCLIEIKAFTHTVNVLKLLQFLFEKLGIRPNVNIKEYNQDNIIDFMNDDNPVSNSNVIINVPSSGNQIMNSKELNSAIETQFVANNVLLELYIDNFKLFKLNYFNNLNLSPNIKDELQIRIDFIPILNKYHPTFDSLAFLSSILISEPSDPQWQRSLFTFIRKNLESSETTNNVIFTLFINKAIDFPALRSDNQIIAYEIFNEAFLSENMKKDNLMYFPKAKTDNALPSYDIQCLISPNSLIGFEYLWDIIFDSNASCVLAHGMEIIHSLFTNYIDDLIDKIFNQLSQKKKVIQMISLMTYIMKESEKSVMSLITSHKSILLHDKVMLYVLSSTGRESYYLYSNITLFNFKLLLCHKRSCPIDKMILSHRGSQLKDSDHIKTLTELGIKHNDDICLTTLIDNTQKPLIVQGKMSPAYEKIINSWFSIFSADERMDAESLAQFTATSTGTPIHYEPDDFLIKDILLHYDIGSKGYLTREEFNKLYFDKASQMPHYVWNSLNLMGIRNDLKEMDEAVAIEIIPKENVIRYKISNDSKWISLLFQLLKEDNNIELFHFIFSLCTNNDIYTLISNGKFTEEILSNQYLMIYSLYIVESALSKETLYVNVKERDDNEILKMHPEFNKVINSKAFLVSFIEQKSHLTLFSYYISNEYDLDFYCHKILVEHLTNVIIKVIMNYSALNDFDMTLLLKKQLHLLIRGDTKVEEVEVEESLMMNGFELIMHLLVFKIGNITELIKEHKQKLLHLIMNGLINKNTDIKKYFGKNLIKYTKLSENFNKGVIVTFLFECCFRIFNKLKTENNLNDLSFFFEYLTSMFENYSSDDHHVSFVNEIIEEIKTNKEIPNEILIGYIKILTKAMRSIQDDNQVFLMKYIMDNIIFQKESPHLVKVLSTSSDYINPSEYILSTISNKGGGENNILQAAFVYIKEVFKQINRKEDIALVEQFLLQKEASEKCFNPKKSTHHQATSNINCNININFVKRRNNNHVGLDNLGFTCYMNSVLQQLFYIDTFKNAILQCPLETDDTFSAGANIIYQLKKLFSYLDISIRLSYDPKAFVSSFNSIINNGLNVIGQQDSQEFLNSFFDVMEKKIKPSRYKYIIDKTFIGRLCSMIICGSCHHTSLRFENFYTLSLDVSNMNNLSNSLEKFISYEVIDEFKCEGCQEKVQIKKRNLLCDLPNILIIHLKRFNMNYETCLTEKLNSRLEFPFSLSMDKYCVETIGDSLNNDEIYRKKDDCYTYSLIGVIVHSGTAEEGHYFSIINNKKDKKWIKVNDSEVSDFDISRLANDCFGELNCLMEEDSNDCFDELNSLMKDDFNNGNWLFNNNANFKDDDSNSKQNAYLLFYEKKKKSDIIIIKDNPSPIETDVIRLTEENSKELLRKYNKDRADYDMEVDTTVLSNSPIYLLSEKTKELFYFAPFDSIDYLIPKDIYVEILKDNFPLEKSINYIEENYNDFYMKVFKTIQIKALEMNLDDQDERWLQVTLMIIFITQKAITANELKILSKFLLRHYGTILDFFANRSSIEKLFITENTESIEFLVTLLLDLIQCSSAQPDSKAFKDSISIVNQIIALFPKISFYYVNKIYPLYNLFYSLVQSNDFWIQLFIEKKMIKVILAYIMGKSSTLFYEFTVMNDHWDASRPINLINVNQLTSFFHFILKKTTLYRNHKFISKDKDKDNDEMLVDNDQVHLSFEISQNDLRYFAEDEVIKMIYTYDFDLFRDLNIILQYNNKENSVNLCKEICYLLFKVMISDEILLSRLMSLVFDIIAMTDNYQPIRLHIVLGYQSALITPSEESQGLPLLGKQLNQIWLQFISYNSIKLTTLMKKIFSLANEKQIEYITQLLSLITVKHQEEKDSNEHSFLFDYCINLKSLNYNHPQFVSYVLDYLANLINSEIESEIKESHIQSVAFLTKDINALISSYPSDLKFNKYIPDKVKYEEINIECQGKGMFLFKTRYYTSVYPVDEEKLSLIKDTYPFISIDYNNPNENINILDSIDRESSDAVFYKKIIPMLNSMNKLIVVSHEDIQYPLLTVVRYGIYNSSDWEVDVSTKLTVKETTRMLIETRLPETTYTNVCPKEYKEVFVINKNDYFDENTRFDEIIINIQLEWKRNYFNQRNKGE